MIFCCQPGFETLLVEELGQRAMRVLERGEGWLRAEATGSPENPAAAGHDWCFAQDVLLDPVEFSGDSVNQIAGRIAEHFFASARTEKFDGPWPLLCETAAGLDGLGRRADGVLRALEELLKKKMSRVAKLAVNEKPRGIATARGLYLFFVDFKRVYVARSASFGGQRRMADDALAPSRSYLKIEEAYLLLGRTPVEGETVVDLGAAPGGWSYSAARHGARVIAVDNGPLKGGALDHPRIEHLRADAFGFRPEPGVVYDWMFCDLVEEPHHVMTNLIDPWIRNGWCRRFVVILKFGRVNPVKLLQEITAPGSLLATHVSGLRVRHLYHNREEFTFVGEVSAPSHEVNS